VLRTFYGFDAMQVVRVFDHLLGLAHINMEEAERVVAALPLTARGMDFADALHLSGSTHCTALYTFDDRGFARRARRLAGVARVMVPDDKFVGETKVR